MFCGRMNPKAQFTELVFLIVIWTRIKLQMLKGGSVAQWLAYLLPAPAALGSIPKTLSEVKLLMLLRLINVAG